MVDVVVNFLLFRVLEDFLIIFDYFLFLNGLLRRFW